METKMNRVFLTGHSSLFTLILLTAVGCGGGGGSSNGGTPDAGTGGAGGDGGGGGTGGTVAVAGLTVSDPNARGCELLLTEGTAEVESVTFDSTVKGTFIREAPRVAISFVAAADAPIAGGAVKVAAAGDSAQLQVKTVHCFDGKAAPLADVSVTLR